ncbi:RagB/SusD family nutrient uptake outer membrane protein [Hymenobacter sp. BT770]|uniref:RagB/SusD family nutrient uptake outer membrane protein n=1 Tax=Hymenobacter sp. BT770 TaxID=2886942 RepID=UPI001D10CF92|nr:RagB/SusD family nutrient uptake outer membrane protein [Hymenobacter sp. BT770]MCC3151959.1 RagB/SusD family nutrient uptake outer membrane protein [Hymenobacter sp. BT770]MDO3417069.1 RagB/SusD family nutrient uptake outer membrane protein [Hymenobacter sp. BT770]
MKFSKYIRLVLAGSVLLTAAACQKDPLDQVNPNVPTTASFWKTSDDAVKGVNAAYSGLQQLGTYRRWLNFAFDTRSDDSFSQSPWGELLDWNRFVQVNYDFEVSQNIWRDHYRAIFRTNQVLDNVPGIAGMDATLQKRVLAEARFLRALYYYNLVALYGNVPLVLKAGATLETNAAQATEAQVWDQIIADLKAAQPDLPASYTGTDLGRATRGAATTLLGKAYMQNRRWADAQAEFAKVIGTTYSLTPNYTDNFRHTTENNSESIFEVQFNDDKLGGNDGDDATSSEGGQRSQFWGAPNAGGFVDAEVRPWVVNEFLKEGTVSGQRDPRLAATVFYNRRLFATTLPLDADTLVYGRGFLARYAGNARDRSRTYWRKYQTDYYRNFENFDSPINQRVMRYADVLLLQAEALNETGNTAGAVPLINQVRQRAGLAPLVAANFTQATLRTQLMHERVTELTGEEQRWFDLKRWGLLESQAGIDQLKARDDHFSTFQLNKSRLLPLPRTDVDLLRLTQNPGY